MSTPSSIPARNPTRSPPTANDWSPSPQSAVPDLPTSTTSAIRGHTVTVDGIRPGGPDNVFTVLDGGGACPPENIGGAAGYQHLLAVYVDPASSDHDDAVDILGPDFDPGGFTPW